MDSSTSTVLDQLRDISLCQMVDALVPPSPFETNIRPIGSHFRITGRAVTVLCPPNDNLTIHHALHEAKPGEVLVVKAGEGCRSGLWGELMALSAKMRGLGGTIIDGAARDQIRITEIGYPVFSAAISPRKADKARYGQMNARIAFGSLIVNPGDVIIADADGIIALPLNRIEEALRLAPEIAKREAEIEEHIRRGRTIFEILELKDRVPTAKEL